MKKGFGIFFLILGLINVIGRIIMSMAHPRSGYVNETSIKTFFFSIGVTGLGFWMITTSQKKKQ